LRRFDEIIDGGGKEVSLPGDRTTLCPVRNNTAVYAYINFCPYTGAPRTWVGDPFPTRDGHMLQYAVLGALFRITDGLCIRGPCLHQRLAAAPVVMRDGDIMPANEEGSRFTHD
jgi:nitrite reductase/ring-hydroxylating ferredoxin subunit